MKLLFIHDRSKASVDALGALVRAVASARSEGLFVEIERLDATLATGPSVVPVPSVFVDGLRASTLTAADIHDAITRAHRRPGIRQVSPLPQARVR